MYSNLPNLPSGSQCRPRAKLDYSSHIIQQFILSLLDDPVSSGSMTPGSRVFEVDMLISVNIHSGLVKYSQGEI